MKALVRTMLNPAPPRSLEAERKPGIHVNRPQYANSTAVASAALEAHPPPGGDVLQQLKHKDMLLREMQHRMGNSLQIVASILLLKARTAQSEEARLHLRDAHGQVMSVAAIQKRLQVSASGEQVELGPYLCDLCASLDDAMIGGTRPIALAVSAENGMVSAQEAVSIGLIERGA